MLPFPLIVLKNVEIKLLSHISVFLCTCPIQHRTCTNAVHVRHEPSKDRTVDMVCTVELHVIFISGILHHFCTSSLTKHHDIHDILYNLKFLLMLRDRSLSKYWTYEKTVISLLLVYFFIWFVSVWYKGVIATRGWCTCTGLSCTFLWQICVFTYRLH